MNENLTWLTQKTEEPKSDKENFTFPKRWQSPISTSSPPSFLVYVLFLAKNLVTPPSDSIFGRSYSPFNKGVGVNVVTMLNQIKIKQKV